jgi:hypothetical protein
MRIQIFSIIFLLIATGAWADGQPLNLGAPLFSGGSQAQASSAYSGGGAAEMLNSKTSIDKPGMDDAAKEGKLHPRFSANDHGSIPVTTGTVQTLTPHWIQ